MPDAAKPEKNALTDPPPPWARSWWRVPLALAALWQIAAAAWALHAWLALPEDRPIPSDPPEYADDLRALRENEPPGTEPEAVLRRLRDDTPARLASFEASTAAIRIGAAAREDAPDDHAPSVLAELVGRGEIPADWEKYAAAQTRQTDKPDTSDATNQPDPADPKAFLSPEAARFWPLLRLGRAYDRLGMGDMATRLRLAAARLAHGHPAWRRAFLADVARDGGGWHYPRDGAEGIAFAAVGLLAETDARALTDGGFDELVRREEAENQRDKIYDTYDSLRPGRVWYNYADLLHRLGAPRAGRGAYRVSLRNAARERRDAAETRLRLATSYFDGGMYPAAALTIQAMHFNERFEGGMCSNSQRLAHGSRRVIVGSALLSGPLAVLTGMARRPFELAPVAVMSLLACAGLWLAFHPCLWRPNPSNLSSEASGPEEAVTCVFHDRRWGILLICHLPPALLMAWWMIQGRREFWPFQEVVWLVMAIFPLSISGFAFLWPLWLGPAVKRLEITPEGLGTPWSFTPWERLRKVEARTGPFAPKLRFVLGKERLGGWLTTSISRPLDHPDAKVLLDAVARHRPDLDLGAPRAVLAAPESAGGRVRPHGGGMVFFALAAAWPLAWLLFSPRSLWAAWPVTGFYSPFDREIISAWGLAFLWISTAAFGLVNFAPATSAGRWLRGMVGLYFTLPLFLLLDGIGIVDAPRWLPTALAVHGLLLTAATLAATLTEFTNAAGSSKVAARRLAVVVAALAALSPFLCREAHARGVRDAEARYPRLVMAPCDDLAPPPSSPGFYPTVDPVWDGSGCWLRVIGDGEIEYRWLDASEWRVRGRVAGGGPVRRAAYPHGVVDGKLLIVYRLREVENGTETVVPPGREFALFDRRDDAMPEGPDPENGDARGRVYFAGASADNFALSHDRRRLAWREAGAEGRGFAVRLFDLETERAEADALDLPSTRDALWREDDWIDGPTWMPDGSLTVTLALPGPDTPPPPSPPPEPRAEKENHEPESPDNPDTPGAENPDSEEADTARYIRERKEARWEEKLKSHKRLARWILSPDGDVEWLVSRLAVRPWRPLPDARYVLRPAKEDDRSGGSETGLHSVESLADGTLFQLPRAHSGGVDWKAAPGTTLIHQIVHAENGEESRPRLTAIDWRDGGPRRSWPVPSGPLDAFSFPRLLAISPGGRFALLQGGGLLSRRLGLMDLDNGRIDILGLRDGDGTPLFPDRWLDQNDWNNAFSPDGRHLSPMAFRSPFGDGPRFFRVDIDLPASP